MLNSSIGAERIATQRCTIGVPVAGTKIICSILVVLLEIFSCSERNNGSCRNLHVVLMQTATP